MNIRIALLAIACAMCPALLHAETLTEDTTWSGEVSITEDLEVATGVVLTVEAGATIAFAEGVSMRVHGQLLARGSEESKITFTRAEGADDWERIFFINAADSVLSHCIVEFSDCEGDHKDLYDDTDSDCEPVTEGRDPRDYFQAVVVINSHVDIDDSLFHNLPDESSGAEGDAIAVISDDPENPGPGTANIRFSSFIGIGQGIHTRYSYVLVEGCFFTEHNGDNDDIDLFGESDPPPMILNNVLIDPDDDDMINPTRCSAVMIGNLIAGSNDHGIVLRDRCDPVLINNVIYDCSSAGIAVQNTCNALMINNTILDSRRGVRFFDHTGRWGRPYCLAPGSGSATLINCIVWDCDTTFDLANSPSEDDPGSHLTLDHCIVQGGEDRLDVSSDSTVTWLEGNLSDEPIFVDPENGDFSLAENSPGIDAGTSAQAPETDYNGRARPCGLAVDIGAVESGECDTVDEPVFIRGDINSDGVKDISDPVSLLIFLFSGGSIDCQKSADTDDDGMVNLTDVIYGLNYLFQGGPASPAPEECGEDPSPDELSCETVSCA